MPFLGRYMSDVHNHWMVMVFENLDEFFDDDNKVLLDWFENLFELEWWLWQWCWFWWWDFIVIHICIHMTKFSSIPWTNIHVIFPNNISMILFTICIALMTIHTYIICRRQITFIMLLEEIIKVVGISKIVHKSMSSILSRSITPIKDFCIIVIAYKN